MKTAGIYRIELGNGWFYIGSAVNLKRRQSNHKSDLVATRHHNPKMQNCWNKYGVFKFTVLEECNNADLLVREQLYLDRHFSDQNNLNLTPTAGSWLGRVHSAETKTKISAALKGRVTSAETKAKMSAAQKGRVASAAQKGRVASAETRAKISIALKGKPKSAETRAKMSASWERKRNLALLG